MADTAWMGGNSGTKRDQTVLSQMEDKVVVSGVSDEAYFNKCISEV